MQPVHINFNYLYRSILYRQVAFAKTLQILFGVSRILLDMFNLIMLCHETE